VSKELLAYSDINGDNNSIIISITTGSTMTPNQPMLLNCPACGAPLDYDGTSSVIRCKFCGNRSLVQGGSAHQDSATNSPYEEIRDLVSSGNLKEALERVRNINGVDLEDANDALEAIKEGRFATKFVSSTHSPAELTQTLQKIQSLLASGNKIDAIKLYRETFDTSMERALHAIEQIENGQGLQIENSFSTYSTQSYNPTPPPYIPPTSNKKGCGLIAIVLTVVILVVVGALIAFKGSIFIPHYYAQEPEILISIGQDNKPQIASVFFDSGADTRFVGLLNPDTKRLIWQASPLKSDNTVSKLVNGSDLIYASSEDNLLAYNKTDGSQAWQTVMPDALNYSDNTLFVAAGRVITRNADQSIQAYNAETGSLVWSKRLTGYSDTMLLLDKSLLVVDYADTDYNYGLYFLDPVTGTQHDLITPTCIINDYASYIDDDTALFYDEDNNALLLIYSEGCIQSINLANKNNNWTTVNNNNFSLPSEGYKYLVTDRDFYFGDDGNLVAVTKSDGKLSILSQNADYHVYPMEIIDNLMILRADRTRGTSRTELWGIDLNTGVQTWQITLQDSEPIDPPNEMSGFIDDTDFGWTLKETPSGLVLITFKGEPNQLVLETLSPTDGRVITSQTIAIKGVTGDFYSIPSVLGWQGNVAFLNIDSSFYTLDVATGELENIY
jgi:outer membrane protein assembly factor BamB